MVFEEIRQRQGKSAVLCKGGDPAHQSRAVPVRGTDIVQYILCRHLFELDVTPFWQGDKPVPDLLRHAPGSVGKQRRVFFFKTIFPVRRSDEVQHGQTFLPLRQTESASQLLQKDGEGFRRAQEQDGVDLKERKREIIEILRSAKEG